MSPASPQKYLALAKRIPSPHVMTQELEIIIEKPN